MHFCFTFLMEEILGKYQFNVYCVAHRRECNRIKYV